MSPVGVWRTFQVGEMHTLPACVPCEQTLPWPHPAVQPNPKGDGASEPRFLSSQEMHARFHVVLQLESSPFGEPLALDMTSLASGHLPCLLCADKMPPPKLGSAGFAHNCGACA